MKKFRLVMYIGNCENFGTEWEELRKEIRIVDAECKEDVIEKYNSSIYDCDCKSFYIEELGIPCYKVIFEDRCMGQFETLNDATTEMNYCLCSFDDLKDAIGKVRIEIGVLE